MLSYKQQSSGRERKKKYSQKNIRIVYNFLCVRVCLCWLYLRIIVCDRISDI